MHSTHENLDSLSANGRALYRATKSHIEETAKAIEQVIKQYESQLTPWGQININIAVSIGAISEVKDEKPYAIEYGNPIARYSGNILGADLLLKTLSLRLARRVQKVLKTAITEGRQTFLAAVLANTKFIAIIEAIRDYTLGKDVQVTQVIVTDNIVPPSNLLN